MHDARKLGKFQLIQMVNQQTNNAPDIAACRRTGCNGHYEQQYGQCYAMVCTKCGDHKDRRTCPCGWIQRGEEAR